MNTSDSERTILIVGASRGLGQAMAREFLARGWRVIGTVRDTAVETPLHELADDCFGRLEIERLDICNAEQIAALDERLAGRCLDALFVNAGTTNRDPAQTIGEITTDEFVSVMITNALAPLKVIEALAHHVPATGMIGAMSSGQGSLSDNEQGNRELYRGSKAALNMFMRSFAARRANAHRALALMAPGWVNTALGGEAAPYSIADAVPPLVDVLLAKIGRPGLEYLDRFGETVPW